MKKRLKEIEEEASALREMQAKVEKEMGAVQGRFLCFIPSDLSLIWCDFCVSTSNFVFFVLSRLKIRLVHLQLKLKRKKWMLGQSMLVMWGLLIFLFFCFFISVLLYNHFGHCISWLIWLCVGLWLTMTMLANC